MSTVGYCTYRGPGVWRGGEIENLGGGGGGVGVGPLLKEAIHQSFHAGPNHAGGWRIHDSAAVRTQTSS